MLRRRTRTAAVSVLVVAAVALAGCGSTPPVRALPEAQSSPVAGPSDPAAASAEASAVAASPSAAAPSPTKKPTTKTPALPPPPAGGKPGPGNTGVPAGTSLRVVNGDQVFSTAGQVISGLDIRGHVKITAANVTLKNSVVRGSATPCPGGPGALISISSSATGARVESTTVKPTTSNACLDGVSARNATLLRMDISGTVDGVKAFDNVTVQDSYIHDLSWFASSPSQGGKATHNDAVQSYEGNRNVWLRHNTMLVGSKGNAGYQVTQDLHKVSTNLHIEYNWIDGGGCMLNFSHNGGPTPMTGIYVVGNRFGRGSKYQCPILISTQTVLSQNSGNVWDDTGAPIPKPQQHD